jgi:hypothetical protein
MKNAVRARLAAAASGERETHSWTAARRSRKAAAAPFPGEYLRPLSVETRRPPAAVINRRGSKDSQLR